MALGLWLCLLAPALWIPSQESCHPNGSLPAPELSLNVSLAHLGDAVHVRCQVHGVARATRVILCKDGQEAASQQFTLGKFSYDFARLLSGPRDAGHFSCRYQHYIDNRPVNSNLSAPRSLELIARDLHLILGISVACTLLLGLLGLLHRVSSARRRPREPGPGGQGGDGHVEEQLHYAALGQLYSPRTLPPKNNDAVTYATLR